MESHPYATAMTPDGTYVADAAGHTTLEHGKNDKLRTVAVLLTISLVIAEEFATGSESPASTVGETHWSRPCRRRRGRPRRQALRQHAPGWARGRQPRRPGSVCRIGPRTGATERLATGLVSAVGLAIGNNRTVFVSELFTGRIPKMTAGASTATTFQQVLLPGAVEIRGGDLYATTQVLTGLSGEPGTTPPARWCASDADRPHRRRPGRRPCTGSRSGRRTSG